MLNQQSRSTPPEVVSRGLIATWVWSYAKGYQHDQNTLGSVAAA